MQDKRRFPRQRTFLRGNLEFDNRVSSVECIVRNTSDAGARIELPSMAGVPPVLTLSIPHRGLRRHGRVVWQRYDMAGIMFDAVAKA
ncbi:MAG: PilZ domain-containing protein [Beijerinckiaceae bacterium]